MREFIDIVCENANLEKLAKKDPFKAADVIRANPELPVSHAVMMAIVKGYGFNIRLFPDAPEDVNAAAVTMFPEAIECIKNPSEGVQKIAVSRDPSTLRFIGNPSEEIQEAAVRSNAMCIRFIENPPPKIQMMAFENAKGAFFETKTPCKELCLAAAGNFGSRVFENSSIDWRGAPWAKEVIKTAMSKSDQDAFDCLQQFRAVPRDLALFAFERDYKCYTIIASKPGYDGFLDAAFAKKEREIAREIAHEKNLPILGRRQGKGSYTQDQMKILRWFELNDTYHISVKELRKQSWGNTPYFVELVKKNDGRDITIEMVKSASATTISEGTIDLLSKATVSVIPWTGGQRLFKQRPNKAAVFHVPYSVIEELTNDEMALEKIRAVCLNGGHPIAPSARPKGMHTPRNGFFIPRTKIGPDTQITIGWVRYTVFDKDIWIDEVQSDLSKILPPDVAVKIKDIQDAIMLAFLQRTRRRGAQKFFMPTYEMKKDRYEASPPVSVYQDLPKKMRFRQDIVHDLDPLVDGEKAWILEGYSHLSL